MPPRMYDFIFIGNEHPIKGMEIIDYILDKLDDKYKVALVGKLPKLLVKYGDKINYTFFGEVTGKRKIEILCNSKVLFLPSYQESFSMVACETLSYGVPVVAFDLPTLRSVYKDYIVYAKYKDSQDMLDKMIHLLEYNWEEKTKELLTMPKFDWDKEAEKILKEL